MAVLTPSVFELRRAGSSSTRTRTPAQPMPSCPCPLSKSRPSSAGSRTSPANTLRCRPKNSTAGSPPPGRSSARGSTILGHHYQRDEVIKYADFTGDSFKLARHAAEQTGRRVRPLLRRPLHGRIRRHPHRREGQGDPPEHGRRLLDGRHGRSRRRLPGLGRDPRDARRARERHPGHLHEQRRQPEGVRRRARRHRLHLQQRRPSAMEYAFERGEKVLFFPDQHLGRNTGYDMGIPLEEMVLWNWRMPHGGTHRGATQEGEGHPLAGPLQHPPALHRRTDREGPRRSTPASASSSTRSAAGRSSRPPMRTARPRRSSRRSPRRPPARPGPSAPKSTS